MRSYTTEQDSLHYILVSFQGLNRYYWNARAAQRYANKCMEKDFRAVTASINGREVPASHIEYAVYDPDFINA